MTRMAQFSNRWGPGVWIGKAEETDERLVLRNNKMLRYRTVHRLTPEQFCTVSAELKATTPPPHRSCRLREAKQGNPNKGEGANQDRERWEPHHVEKQPRGGHPVARDSWLPGLSEEARLSPQCCLQCSKSQVGQIGSVRCCLGPRCKSNSPKQSSEQGRDPVTHGRSKLRNRLDRSGTERKWRRHQWNKKGRPAQEDTRRRKRAKDHRRRRSRASQKE